MESVNASSSPRVTHAALTSDSEQCDEQLAVNSIAAFKNFIENMDLSMIKVNHEHKQLALGFTRSRSP